MLIQRGNDGKFHLVYAISRSTSPPDKSYHSSKLEMLAIIWAVTRLCNFLVSIKFTIITDCRALIYVRVNRTKNPQFIRWQNLLSEWDYEIRHQAGEKMAHLDALSRIQHESEESVSNGGTMFSISNPTNEAQLYQFSDEKIQGKIKILQKADGEHTTTKSSKVKGYVLQHGLLYKLDGGDLKILIPNAMRKSLVVRSHDLQGHFGLDRTLRKMREFYFFPCMNRYVRQHIRACLQCIANKSLTGKQPGELLFVQYKFFLFNGRFLLTNVM